jgi:transcriptional regulator with XRE-family HTH domain
MKFAKALARRIKALREAVALSPEEVAARANLSLSRVTKLEAGKKSDPRVSTILALASALGVKPGAILEDLLPVSPPSAGESAATANGETTTGDQNGKPKKKKKDKKKRQS